MLCHTDHNMKKFKFKLKTSMEYDDVPLINKPNKKMLALTKLEHYTFYQILYNKYELLTFENINKIKDINKTLYSTINGIITIATIPLVPILNNIFCDYAFNPYFSALKNKKILIIKQAFSPDFIIESFLNIQNTTHTIFNDTTGHHIITEYNYEIITDIKSTRYATLMKEHDVVIIIGISADKYLCETENTTLIKTVEILSQYDAVGKLGSDLIIHNYFPHSMPNYQLYHYLFKMHESVSWYKIKTACNNKDGIFIFVNKKTQDNIIIITLALNDHNNKNQVNTKDHAWCKASTNTGHYITNLFSSILISDNFKTFLAKIYKLIKNSEKKFISKIMFIHDQVFRTGNMNMSKVKTFLLYNIDECLAHYSKHTNINEYYTSNKIINIRSLIKSTFPYATEAMMNKIMLSRDSIYSVSSHEVADRTSLLIKRQFKVNNIIDGTANIGGNTVNFARHFVQVVSNEICKDTYNHLYNNVKTLNCKNVKCFNSDIITLISTHKHNFDAGQWCLYLDPPWSGIYYKLETVIDLYLGKTNIIEFIKNIDLKYICIKVPKNYNLSALFDNFNNIIIHKVIYCYIILIIK